MTTAFKTGPGFFAAETDKSDPAIPEGKMRIYTCTIEAYDLDQDERRDMDTSFTILAARAEENKGTAKALLNLHQHLKGNLSHIQHAAK